MAEEVIIDDILPTEVCHIIKQYLPIEQRISIRFYQKVKIPQGFEEKLSKIPKIKCESRSNTDFYTIISFNNRMKMHYKYEFYFNHMNVYGYSLNNSKAHSFPKETWKLI